MKLRKSMIAVAAISALGISALAGGAPRGAKPPDTGGRGGARPLAPPRRLRSRRIE